MQEVLSLLLLSAATAAAFQCYTCNERNGEDDTKPCIQKVEECPEGVDSCSTVAYSDPRTGALHSRKFCTAPGTPIYQYLLFFPGSSLCQNINTGGPVAPTPPRSALSRRRVRRTAAPPAPPPSRSTSSLLCVCTTPLCNDGSHREVLERTMLANIQDSPADLRRPAKLSNAFFDSLAPKQTKPDTDDTDLF